MRQRVCIQTYTHTPYRMSNERIEGETICVLLTSQASAFGPFAE